MCHQKQQTVKNEDVYITYNCQSNLRVFIPFSKAKNFRDNQQLTINKQLTKRRCDGDSGKFKHLTIPHLSQTEDDC